MPQEEAKALLTERLDTYVQVHCSFILCGGLGAGLTGSEHLLCGDIILLSSCVFTGNSPSPSLFQNQPLCQSHILHQYDVT